MRKIESKKNMKKAKFIGADESQSNWGSCDNPNKSLVVNECYNVKKTNIHAWHTTYTLESFGDKKFPSTAFELV